MEEIILSSTGIYLPEEFITNEELTTSFNNYVRLYNNQHAQDIKVGIKEPLSESNPAFIYEASGIKKRHVLNKQGILDINTMHPIFPKRKMGELSLQSEIAVQAAKEAMNNAKKKASDIQMVIAACSNYERPYPGIAVETQAALGIKGFAYDMNAACSSASFGLHIAYNAIASKAANCVLMINPEIYTAHANFHDRRSHFIFGDGCSAAIIEQIKSCNSAHPYKILSTKLETNFSNNIRNNTGFLNRCYKEDFAEHELLFSQNGKLVREDVVPFAIKHIREHLATHALTSSDIKRLWLHQANSHMNTAIAKNILGLEPTPETAPMILAELGNLGAAGVMVAFQKYHQDLSEHDIGVLSSFGAGYAVGSIILQKL